MGEISIGDVLILLDQRFPDELSFGEIRKELSIRLYNSRDGRRKLIDSALKTLKNGKYIDVLEDKSFNSPESKEEARSIQSDMLRVRLNAKGFELLNQIRIKQTLESLNSSIRNFDGSSQASFKKLDKSINDADKSNKNLTRLLIILTAIIAITGAATWGALLIK